MLLAVSQSTLPQAQAAELAVDPSVVLHGAYTLHLFSDFLQRILLLLVVL